MSGATADRALRDEVSMIEPAARTPGVVLPRTASTRGAGVVSFFLSPPSPAASSILGFRTGQARNSTPLRNKSEPRFGKLSLYFKHLGHVCLAGFHKINSSMFSSTCRNGRPSWSPKAAWEWAEGRLVPRFWGMWGRFTVGKANVSNGLGSITFNRGRLSPLILSVGGS
jgi:hypothetical protein